jgi:hypothetical protein
VEVETRVELVKLRTGLRAKINVREKVSTLSIKERRARAPSSKKALRWLSG